MAYEIPGMSPAERAIFARLTDGQKMAVHYEGWCAVEDQLTDAEMEALIEDFETYGDR